jgi:hypothetical protein
MRKEDVDAENHSMCNKENLFQILGLKESFNINSDKLESNYINSINLLNNDDENKIFKLNQSYHILKNTISRAKYIMSLLKIEVDDNIILEDPKLLQNFMENREKLYRTDNIETLKILKKMSTNHVGSLIHNLTILFYLIQEIDNKEMSPINVELYKVNYFNRYLIEINDKIFK